jgi:hypothetical protein
MAAEGFLELGHEIINEWAIFTVLDVFPILKESPRKAATF